MITFCSKLYFQGKKINPKHRIHQWFCPWVFSVLVTPLNTLIANISVDFLQLALSMFFLMCSYFLLLLLGQQLTLVLGV